MTMTPLKKKHLVQGAVLGAIIGVALAGVIWFTTESLVLTIGIIPVAAILGGAQLYLSTRE